MELQSSPKSSFWFNNGSWDDVSDVNSQTKRIHRATYSEVHQGGDDVSKLGKRIHYNHSNVFNLVQGPRLWLLASAYELVNPWYTNSIKSITIYRRWGPGHSRLKSHGPWYPFPETESFPMKVLAINETFQMLLVQQSLVYFDWAAHTSRPFA
jgi:hypothetical protein